MALFPGGRKFHGSTLVLPGEYKVTLTADGNSYSQTFQVKMDPREKVSDKVLNDQLKLALKIWNTASDQFQIQTALESLSKSLSSIQKADKPDDKISTAADDLKTKINSLRSLLASNGIAGLEGAVMSADREPTKAMYEAFDIRSKNTKLAEDQWKKIKSEDLPKLNELLKGSGILLIKIPTDKAEHYLIP